MFFKNILRPASALLFSLGMITGFEACASLPKVLDLAPIPAVQAAPSPIPPGFKSFETKVLKVADGDTVTVHGPEGKKVRIRLLGIDAPESNQPYGKQSTDSLEQMIRKANYRVTIVYNKSDKYGRIVGKVVANGKDLNLEQLKRGMAWSYKNYFKDVAPQDRALYSDAEHQARRNRVGLWSEKNPTPPWDWRKQNRGK